MENRKDVLVIVSESSSELKSAIYLREILAKFFEQTHTVVVKKEVSVFTKNSRFGINTKYIHELLTVLLDKISTVLIIMLNGFPYKVRFKDSFFFRRVLRLQETLNYFSNLQMQYIDDLNGREMIDVLEKFQPSVVVLAGCGIVKKKFIDKSRLIVNVHSSKLPGVRGIDSEFWCLKLSHEELIGHSVHEVISIIDGGEILSTYSLPVQHMYAPNHRNLRLLNIHKGAETLVRYLDDKLLFTKQTELTRDVGYKKAPSFFEKIKFYYYE